MEIPTGNTKEEMDIRKQIIKDFYAQWNAEHPDKQMWNKDLQDYIHVKYLSINETARKAARRYLSTLAVLRLSELLSLAKKIEEVPIKKDRQNQRPFTKMIIMKLDDIKLTVGVQRSTGDKIQYCVTSLKEEKPPDEGGSWGSK